MHRLGGVFLFCFVLFFSSVPHLVAFLLPLSDYCANRDKNSPDWHVVSLGAASHWGHQLCISKMGSTGEFVLPELFIWKVLPTHPAEGSTETAVGWNESDLISFWCFCPNIRWQIRWRWWRESVGYQEYLTQSSPPTSRVSRLLWVPSIIIQHTFQTVT